MQALKALNLLSAHKLDKSILTWPDLIEDGIRRIHDQLGGDNSSPCTSQSSLSSEVVSVPGRERLRRALSMHACGVRDVDSAIEALEWLGVTPALVPVAANSSSSSSSGSLNDEEQTEIHNEISLKGAVTNITGGSPMDALSALMTEHRGLAYQQGERDMVAMYHTVVGVMSDGSEERHTSRLMAFGAPTKGKRVSNKKGRQEGLKADEDDGEEEGDSAMSATVGYTTAAAVELLLQLNPAHRRPSDLEGPGSGISSGLGGRSGVLIPITPDIYEPILSRLNDCGITWTETITVRHKQL